MSRVPNATRKSAPEGQRKPSDELVPGMRSVPRYGPGSVMIHVSAAHRDVWPTVPA